MYTRLADEYSKTWTPLHTAIFKLAVEQLETKQPLGSIPDLIAQGENVEAKTSPYGLTPLMYAAAELETDVVKFLVEAGANVFAQSNRGETAQCSVMENARESFYAKGKAISEFLSKSGKQRDEYKNLDIHAAAQFGYISIIDQLLKGGESIDRLHSKHERTALSFAAQCGQEETVKFLLDHGAKFQADDRLWTPLIYAIAHHQTDIAKLLIERGADVNAKAKASLEPFYNYPDNIPTWLSEKDVEPTEEKPTMSPLTFAAKYGNLDIVQSLVKKGAKDVKEATSWAKLNENREMISYFKQLKAGNTIEQAAQTERFKTIAQELAEKWGPYSHYPACPGVLEFSVEKEYEPSFRALQKEVLQSKYSLISGDQRKVFLYPTDDKYLIIELIGTDESNWDISNKKIINWLKKFEKNFPFILIYCVEHSLGGLLLNEVSNLTEVAKEIAKFCKDSDPNEAEKLKRIEAELKENSIFYLGWN